MDRYFGYGCEYLIGQWERGETAEQEPVLTYCKHERNIEDCEGNCHKAICPLRR